MTALANLYVAYTFSPPGLFSFRLGSQAARALCERLWPPGHRHCARQKANKQLRRSPLVLCSGGGALRVPRCATFRASLAARPPLARLAFARVVHPAAAV